MTTVYTDGSCLGNPGPGGWAWVVPGGRFASGADPSTTNQRMEVTATLRALEALRAIGAPGALGAPGAPGAPGALGVGADEGAVGAGDGEIGAGDGEILVRSDSMYVVNCFVQRWWAGWLRRNWRNSQGKPVANRDLWEQLFAFALEPASPVRFEWVKGHSGDRWNDVVDELALAAASSGVGRSGTF